MKMPQRHCTTGSIAIYTSQFQLSGFRDGRRGGNGNKGYGGKGRDRQEWEERKWRSGMEGKTKWKETERDRQLHKPIFRVFSDYIGTCYSTVSDALNVFSYLLPTREA